MYFPIVGSKFFVSLTDPKAGTAKTVSNMTNDDPVVVTATAHGYADGAEVLLDVGWEDFSNAVFRIDDTTTNTFELPGYDATDTDFFPQGSDVGSAYSGWSWQSLGQILDWRGDGGGTRQVDLTPYELRNGVRIYTGFEASGLTFELGYDRSRADQQTLERASRVLGRRVIKIVAQGPTYFYGYGVVNMSPMPIFGDVLRRQVTVSFDGLVTGF